MPLATPNARTAWNYNFYYWRILPKCYLERSEKDAVRLALSFFLNGSPLGALFSGGSALPWRGSPPLDDARSNGDGDLCISAIMIFRK
jgi:hypothetical protein